MKSYSFEILLLKRRIWRIDTTRCSHKSNQFVHNVKIIKLGCQQVRIPRQCSNQTIFCIVNSSSSDGEPAKLGEKSSKWWMTKSAGIRWTEKASSSKLVCDQQIQVHDWDAIIRTRHSDRRSKLRFHFLNRFTLAGRHLRASPRWRCSQWNEAIQPRLGCSPHQTWQIRRHEAKALHSLSSFPAIHWNLLQRERPCHVFLEGRIQQSLAIRLRFLPRWIELVFQCVGKMRWVRSRVPLLVRVSRYCFLFQAKRAGSLVLQWNNKLSFRKSKDIHLYARRYSVSTAATCDLAHRWTESFCSLRRAAIQRTGGAEPVSHQTANRSEAFASGLFNNREGSWRWRWVLCLSKKMA